MLYILYIMLYILQVIYITYCVLYITCRIICMTYCSRIGRALVSPAGDCWFKSRSSQTNDLLIKVIQLIPVTS